MAYKSSVSALSNDSDSITLPAPAGIEEGDLILVSVVMDSSGGGIGAPEGFVDIESAFGADYDSFICVIFYKIATDDEPSSYTFSISPAADAAASLGVFSGVTNPSSPIADVQVEKDGSDNPIQLPDVTVTPPAAGADIVWFGTYDTWVHVINNVYTAPDGMELRTSISGTNSATENKQVMGMATAVASSTSPMTLTGGVINNPGGTGGQTAAFGIALNTTSVVADTTPDPFTFTDETNVPLFSVRTSNTITITGIDAPTEFSVTGAGQAEVNGSGVWVTSGTVEEGDTIVLRHTSSNLNSTAVSTTLTVGGVSDTFTSTTTAAAATPGISDILRGTDTGLLFANKTGLKISVRADSDAESTLWKTASGSTNAEGRFILNNSAIGTTIGQYRFVTIDAGVIDGERIVETYYLPIIDINGLEEA